MSFFSHSKPPILQLYEFLDVPLYYIFTHKFDLPDVPELASVQYLTRPLPSCYYYFDDEQKLLFLAAVYCPKDPFGFFYHFLSRDMSNSFGVNCWDIIMTRFEINKFPFVIHRFISKNYLALFMYFYTNKYRLWMSDHELNDTSPISKVFEKLAIEQSRMHKTINYICRDTFFPVWVRRNEATRYDQQDVTMSTWHNSTNLTVDTPTDSGTSLQWRGVDFSTDDSDYSSLDESNVQSSDADRPHQSSDSGESTLYTNDPDDFLFGGYDDYFVMGEADYDYTFTPAERDFVWAFLSV